MDKSKSRKRKSERNMKYSSKSRKEDERSKHQLGHERKHLDPKTSPGVVKKPEDEIAYRTGGAYIPPAKLKLMQAEITDKSSPAYQRLAWEALKKSLNGIVNKVNVSNITVIVKEELFLENLIRGRGLLCRAIMQAQAASPTFTNVYACLIAIINTKFPQIGELLIHRLIIQFKRGYKHNNKTNCLSSTRFLAHLINQQVAHEVLGLEILTLLLENATEDSVEIGVGFLKECGMKLTEVSPKGVHAIFERLRNILHEANLDRRYQYMIEVIFAVRKDGFKDNPSVIEELDLVDEEDQFTHLTALDDAVNGQETLNIFNFDPNYEENEERYKAMRMEILDQGSSSPSSENEAGASGEEESGDEEEAQSKDIIDSTETELVSLRRTIYLTIQSSLDFEECAHKLLKIEMKPGQEKELCHMILDCCAQMRTYEKFFGLLAQRFCDLDNVYQEHFQVVYQNAYDTIHRFDNNKLRNAAKFFAHLLYTDALPWTVLSHVKLNEDDTTSSSRIFIKILFQELAEHMGLAKLHERCQDPTMQECFEGLLPRDNPRNTRFVINFFTSIGLGGLTDELREHLKNQPKPTAVIKPQIQELIKNLETSSDDSSSDEINTITSNPDKTDNSIDSVSEKKKKLKEKEKKKMKSKKKKKHKKLSAKKKNSKTKQKKETHEKQKKKQRKKVSNKKKKKKSKKTDSDISNDSTLENPYVKKSAIVLSNQPAIAYEGFHVTSVAPYILWLEKKIIM